MFGITGEEWYSKFGGVLAGKYIPVPFAESNF